MKLCHCGCGSPITSPWAKFLPACHRRAKTLRRLELKSLARRALVRGPKVEPMSPRRLVCKVCFDLSERRESTCKGCGLPWALERRSA